MKVAPFGSKRCRGFPSRKHSCVVQRNLSVESLPIEDIKFQRLPQFWRSCQRESLCILSVTGFASRITLQLINHTLYPDRTTATLKQQSQIRLRDVNPSNVEIMNQLPNTLTFSWRNIIFGFLSRRCNKNCGRDGQPTVSFRQEKM